MKNILAENLLRFGVRNLSKSEVSKIQRLMEQDDQPFNGTSTGQVAMQQFQKLGLTLDTTQKNELIKQGFLSVGSYDTVIKNYYNDPGTGAGFIGKPLIYRFEDLQSYGIDPKTKQPIAYQTDTGHLGTNNTNIKLTKPVQSTYFCQASTGDQYCYIWINNQAIYSQPALINLAQNARGENRWSLDHSIAQVNGRQNFAIWPKNESGKYANVGSIDWFDGSDLTTLRPVNYDYYIDLKLFNVYQNLNNKQIKVGTIPSSCFNPTGQLGNMHGVEIRK